MIGDKHTVSENFLAELLSLGLTVDDIQETMSRKKGMELHRIGIVDKIPAKEAFDVFLTNLNFDIAYRREYATTSKATYRQVLHEFYHYCMTMDDSLEVKGIYHHVLPFLIDITEKRRLQPATWNKYAAVLRAFMHELADRYKIPKGTLPRFQRQIQHLPQALTDSEVIQLLEAAKRAQYGLRTFFMISFFLGTGVRRDEFRRILLGDVDLSIPAAIVRGKGNRRRNVIIPEGLLPILLSYCEVYGITRPHHYLYGKVGDPSQFVSNNTLDDTARRVFRRMPTYREDDSRHRYHLHTLRHTYATRLLRSGASYLTIAQAMGHMSMKSVQRYTALDAQNLREQLEPGLTQLSSWWRGDFH